MDLAQQVYTSGRGIPRVIRTVEQALQLIDHQLAPELASQPRWTFARALLVEATRTGKSRDMNTAVRQLKEALRVEHWLDARGSGDRGSRDKGPSNKASSSQAAREKPRSETAEN